MVLALNLKIRTIDPEVLVRQGDHVKVQRLSELDADYGREREAYIDSKRNPIYVAVS